MIGTNLSHYRVTARIGAGGMGEVYRAEDTHLGRDVAIKVLPDDFAADPERLARFEREARLLASLNHPNIAAIHGFEAVEGRRFLVLELVEGEDLSQRLARGAVPADEALEIAKQIADAVEEAHEKGVVHRDLKPANVKLTPDGKVKVLDFGLAKAWGGDAPSGSGSSIDLSESPTLAHAGTRAGVILGTAAYMSPEQARGKPVDKRSDIWAFGVVLFEMLTGRSMFGGETVSDVLAAVLRQDVDWERLPATTPPVARQLLGRCLERDPRRRLRDIGEARLILETPLAAPDASPRAAPAAPRQRFVLAALALVAVAFAAGYASRRPSPVQTVLNPDVVVRKLTFDPGLETEPSFSPDGNYLAFTSDDKGSLDILVLPLAGGQFRRLVDDPADDAQPAWSPDGTRLAFTSARDQNGRLHVVGGLDALGPFVLGQGGDLFVMPAAGGAASKLVENGAYPSWSPDSQSIVFQSDRSGHWDIWTVPSHGGEPRALTADPETDYQPAWSPDGQWVAYASRAGLRVVPASGGAFEALTEEQVAAPYWSPDGRWIYFASTRSRGTGVTSLWRVPFPAPTGALPEAQRVTLSDSSDIDPRLSQDGRRLAFSRVVYSPDVWELDLKTRTERQITTSSAMEDEPHLSPDGATLVFSSTRAGPLQVWTRDLRSGEMAPVSSPERSGQAPRWSPDGRQIAFFDGPEGKVVLQTVGSLSTRDLAAGIFPDWSPDGKRLALNLNGPEGLSSIAVVDLEGRVTRRVELPGLSSDATWSPDGRQLAFQNEHEGPRQIWAVPAEGGEPRRLTNGAVQLSHPAWSPTDADRILVVVDHKNLALVSVASGEVETITRFEDATILVDYPTWSPDGTKAYFSVTQRIGDLLLLEGY